MNSLQAQTKLQTAYAAAGGVGALPWDKIIEIVMKIVSACGLMNTKTTAENAPLVARLIVARKLKEELPSVKLNQRLIAAQVGVDFVAKTSVSALKGIE